jgi:ribonuclease HI
MSTAGEEDKSGVKPASEAPRVTIYTDGAAEPNPGPGGYGVVLISGKSRKELSRGFRLTTNNRMDHA